MDTRSSAPDTWIPESATEWYGWLAEEERKTVAAYCDAIKAQYAAFNSRTLGLAGFSVTPAPKPSEPLSLAASGSETAAVPPTPGAASSQPTQALQIVEKEHVPQPPAQQRRLQIRTVTSSTTKPGTGTGQRVTDGDFCERKAMEFEEACDPSRWPLAVGQIMGAEGPGCDILNFVSQEAREAFRQGINRELDTLARFIELKGRGSELAILDNPLAHPEALRSAVHVGMEQAKATQRFALFGGLRKD